MEHTPAYGRAPTIEEEWPGTKMMLGLGCVRRRLGEASQSASSHDAVVL